MSNILREKHIEFDDFDEIDLFLKKKYDEITIPEGMFNTEKIFSRIKLERKKRVKRIFAITFFLFILIIIICILYKNI